MLKHLPIAAMIAALLTFNAHAADPDAMEALRNADSVAWSLRDERNQMVVAVSPARQTLQIAGSFGTVLGTSISAIANDKYRRDIEEALAGYDGAAVFREKLEQRLGAALGERARKVTPMASTAGYNNPKDAERERLAALYKAGNDLVLDVEAEYGLFGYQGLLVAKLTAKLSDTNRARKVWGDNLIASAEYILASDKLADPTNQLMPNITDPRFGVSEDAIAQWTGDGGATFRQRFEAAVDGVISALLMELGLEESAEGGYYLGRIYLMRKKFDAAEGYFNISLKMAPDHVPAKNGMSVTLYHKKQLDDAIALATTLSDSTPDFAPAQYNLAWWHAVEKKDAAAALPYYERARALGMSTPKKLDKAVGEKR